MTTINGHETYTWRADEVLKSELTTRCIEKAREYLTAKEIKRGQLQHAATEDAETRFQIDDALTETLGSLQAIDIQEPILIRVIDHVCSSDQCVSYRLVAMMKRIHWKISADLCNDQPLDACGYIAADAVCRLYDAALFRGM